MFIMRIADFYNLLTRGILRVMILLSFSVIIT